MYDPTSFLPDSTWSLNTDLDLLFSFFRNSFIAMRQILSVIKFIVKSIRPRYTKLNLLKRKVELNQF